LDASFACEQSDALSNSSRMSNRLRQPFFEIRPSPIQGQGAFATRRIRKGTRIIEYLGERITPQEGDERYEDARVEHSHVLLFTVDKRTVIDAGVGGNEARFINHSCAPNCEAVTENRRIYIEALRTIAVGEELTYDYQLEHLGHYTVEEAQRYACRCGTANCRGTMLAPPPKRRKVRRAKK
jgi:uncharacterized protein